MSRADGFKAGTTYNRTMSQQPDARAVIAAAHALDAACRRGEHAEATAQRGRLGFGVHVEPGTRYCRRCSMILPPLYVATPHLALFDAYCRNRGIPRDRRRWLHRTEQLRGLSGVEVVLVTEPGSYFAEPDFLACLRSREAAGVITTKDQDQ